MGARIYIHDAARGLLPAGVFAGRGAAAARGTGTGRCRACTPLANAASLPFPSLATLLYAIRIVTVPCLKEHGQIVPKTPWHAPVGSEAPADDMHGCNMHCI